MAEAGADRHMVKPIFSPIAAARWETANLHSRALLSLRGRALYVLDGWYAPPGPLIRRHQFVGWFAESGNQRDWTPLGPSRSQLATWHERSGARHEATRHTE